MTTQKTEKPPKNLGKSKAFWVATMSKYELESHHVELLRLACEALDRIESARAAVIRDGEYFETPSGFKAHGGLKIEHDSRAQFVRIIRELGMDLADNDSRPTQTRAGGKGRTCRG